MYLPCAVVNVKVDISGWRLLFVSVWQVNDWCLFCWWIGSLTQFIHLYAVRTLWYHHDRCQSNYSHEKSRYWSASCLWCRFDRRAHVTPHIWNMTRKQFAEFITLLILYSTVWIAFKEVTTVYWLVDTDMSRLVCVPISSVGSSRERLIYPYVIAIESCFWLCLS